MTSPRATHRYPRRGERIAPQALREALDEPIAAAEAAASLERPARRMRLGDLDETAWSRFSEGTLVELSRRIVDRVAALHARKFFHYKRFPRPPADVRLEDLRIEGRTRRCLAREGFDDNLTALGDRTIDEILSLRGFGPRALVDLLVALESWSARREWPTGAGGGETMLSEALTDAARRLGTLPEAPRILRKDPRFSELIGSIDPEADTAAELSELLLSRSIDPPDPEVVVAELERLMARIKALSSQTIEEELTDLFASGAGERNREILTRYYGWKDGRPHTLTEVGSAFGVTRERIRQVCEKLTQRRRHDPALLVPAMDRALELIRGRLPAPAAELEQALVDEGLTRVGMCLESVLAGARLLDRTAGFVLVDVEPASASSARLAVRPADARLAPAIADAARKEVHFRGLTTVERVEQLVAKRLGSRLAGALVAETVRLLDGFRWLDQRGGWFQLEPVGRHGLPKTIDKVLSVAGSLPIADLRAAVGRNRRHWDEPPPAEVLLEFCRHLPGVRVEGDRVTADPPRDWREALTGIEARLVEVLSQHGPIMERGGLEDLCISGGMNRFSFHAFISWSPVIVQLGHSVYGLVGVKAGDDQIREMAARRRARRATHRVLEAHGTTDDGRIWLRYHLSKAASTYAVVTIPASLKNVVGGRFTLIDADGRHVGTLATKDGRAWGLGALLRQHGARKDDRIVVTFDLEQRIATVRWETDAPAGHRRRRTSPQASP